jgi:mannose-6-phosphate isomerase-like protein (cupin superfamily)
VATDEAIRLFDGSEYRVLERPAGPGDALVMEFRLVDRCGSPPPHFHPRTDEVFEVLDGEFELCVGSEWRRVRAGESLTVPAGQRHTFRNQSGGTVVVKNTHQPHHDFEAYLRKLVALANELRVTSPNSPRAAIRFALLLGQHPDLIRPADRPMQVALPVLRAVGRALRVEAPAEA